MKAQQKRRLERQGNIVMQKLDNIKELLIFVIISIY